MMWPSGVITAIATPLHPDGTIDAAALSRHTVRLVAAGIDGILVCGTTGQGAFLSPDEKEAAARIVLDASGHVPVFAAALAAHTEAVISEAARYAQLGVAAIAAVTPFYSRPTQCQIVAHFDSIAATVRQPLIVYNIPACTGTAIARNTLAELAAHPNVVAVKDSSGDFGSFSRLLLNHANDASWIMGEDSLAASALTLGATGVVSGLSNLVPELFVALSRAVAARDDIGARQLQRAINGLCDLVDEAGGAVALVQAGLAAEGYGSGRCKMEAMSLQEAWRDRIRTGVQAARARARPRCGPGR